MDMHIYIIINGYMNKHPYHGMLVRVYGVCPLCVHPRDPILPRELPYMGISAKPLKGSALMP